MYRNESEIGKALKELGVRREDVFITSKLKPADQGSEKAPKAIEQSLKNLGTDYLVRVSFSVRTPTRRKGSTRIHSPSSPRLTSSPEEPTRVL